MVLSKSQRSPPPLIDTPSLALIRKQLSDKFSEAASSLLNNLKKKRASNILPEQSKLINLNEISIEIN